MFGFSNEVTYVLTSINIIGALTTAGFMLWASRNSVAPLRPIYSAIGVLSLAFFMAHVFILFDIDNAGWLGYMHVLRILSWPFMCAIPIVGHNWIRSKSQVIDLISEDLEKRTPNEW